MQKQPKFLVAEGTSVTGITGKQASLETTIHLATCLWIEGKQNQRVHRKDSSLQLWYCKAVKPLCPALPVNE